MFYLLDLPIRDVAEIQEISEGTVRAHLTVARREILGVSRQPVREALQWLNNEGWVDLRPGYPARLAALNADADGITRLKELCRAGTDGISVAEHAALIFTIEMATPRRPRGSCASTPSAPGCPPR